MELAVAVPSCWGRDDHYYLPAVMVVVVDAADAALVHTVSGRTLGLLLAAAEEEDVDDAAAAEVVLESETVRSLLL